jgi:hypothetical protein
VDGCVFWVLILAATWFAIAAFWPFKRSTERPSAKNSAVPPRDWSDEAPPIGARFEHCGVVMMVIDDGQLDGEGWREGVLANYCDDAGHICRLWLTPAQWSAVDKRTVVAPTRVRSGGLPI